MDGSPTVSVIIPTYNRAHVLGRSIQSVLNQTYQDFELIVVDDGSSDNTEEVVRNFNDIRIKYIRHDKNRGLSAARNTGIKAARGQYIALNDDDDEWLPHHLEKSVSAFRKASPQIGVVYSGYLNREGGRETYVSAPKTARIETNVHASLLRGNFVGVGTAVMRRECFAKAGLFDECCPSAEDWEFWLRVAKYYHFKYIDEPTVIKNETPGSLLSDTGRLIKGFELILAKNYQDFLADKRALANLYAALGYRLCAGGDLPRGRGYFIRAVKAYPLGLHLGAAFASLLGQRMYSLVAAMWRKFRDWLVRGLGY